MSPMIRRKHIASLFPTGLFLLCGPRSVASSVDVNLKSSQSTRNSKGVDLSHFKVHTMFPDNAFPSPHNSYTFLLLSEH